MRAGTLRSKVTHRTTTTSKDAFGTPTTSVVDGEIYRVAIEALSMDERPTDMGMQAGTLWRVSMRYTDAISITDQLVYGSHTLEIIELINVKERNRELALLCKEAVNG